MGEGQPGVDGIEQRRRQHLHGHEAAGAGQLQHQPDDGDGLADVAEADGKGIHEVREYHGSQAAGGQVQHQMLAFHAEEEHVAEPHDKRLGQADQSEHAVAAEVQLGGPRRTAELLRERLLACRRDGHAHERHHEDGADPQAQRRVEGAHGAAVVGHGVHGVLLQLRRGGDELGDSGRVVADDAPYLVDVAGAQRLVQIVAGLGQLAGGGAQRVGRFAQGVLGRMQARAEGVGGVAEACGGALQGGRQGRGVVTHLLQTGREALKLALQLIVVGGP